MITKRPSERYRYQEILWGGEGQKRLATGRVGIFGLGGTGAAHAHLLARAGVGYLRLIDRDVVEFGDLHRSQLYTAEDAKEPTPKAVAAARHLAVANPDVRCDPRVVLVTPRNVRELATDLDVIVDGSDNFALRLLLNDYAVKFGVPLVYQGATAGTAATMAVVPEKGPCLNCILGPLPQGTPAPTCAQVGVSPFIVAAVSAIAAAATAAILRGEGDKVAGLLTRFEETGFAKTVMIERRPGCPSCGERRFPYLEGKFFMETSRICGGRAFEVVPRRDAIPLRELAARLKGKYRVRETDSLLLVDGADISLIVFGDGRALIYGAADEAEAEAMYDRLIGR